MKTISHRVVAHGSHNANGDSYGYIQTEKAAIDVVAPPNVKEEFPGLLALYAAAPDLLDACRWLLEISENGETHQDQQSVAEEKARKAIAKAMGE